MVGINYDLNLMGIKLSEENLQAIPYPRAELGTHITLKLTQAFSILGCAAGAGVSAIQGQRDCDSLQQKAFTFGQYGIIAGLIGGPILTTVFIQGKSTDSIVDRCYRLRVNKHQVRADRWALLGAAVGAGAAYYCGQVADQGALFGFAGGCVLAGVANRFC